MSANSHKRTLECELEALVLPMLGMTITDPIGATYPVEVTRKPSYNAPVKRMIMR